MSIQLKGCYCLENPLARKFWGSWDIDICKYVPSTSWLG